MDSVIEIYSKGEWRAAAALTVTPRAARFEYLPEYVFGENALPVALSLPVSMERAEVELGSRQTRLAFLWDLVPQGRGRQHLANLLGINEQDPAQDLFLAQNGAFAPIGRLRLDTAVRFYQQHAATTPSAGFTLDDMARRTDAFLEQLAVHSMLAAGTPGVQGVAPKFLLTQAKDEQWFPDVALLDTHAHKHWIVKLPRGRERDDLRILHHEAIYLQAAGQCELRTIEAPKFRDGMLFLPRFDRLVDAQGVVRLHQETLASIMGAAGFGRSASLFAVTKRLAEIVTHPVVEIPEFLCRDVLNRALRNPDNHLRNTSVQQLPDGTVQLTPLYDLAPMYLDAEVITRTCAWLGPNNQVLDDWGTILELLPVDAHVKTAAASALRRFGETHVPALLDRLRALGADEDIVESCNAPLEQLQRNLLEIPDARPSPKA